MRYLESFIEKLVSWLVILSLGGIFFFVIMQVAFRFIVQSPLPWPEELSRILFGYLVFIGGAEASMNKTHIAIDAVDTVFKREKTKAFVDIVRSICMFFVLVFIIHGAWVMIPRTKFMALPATGLPMWVMVLPVLVGSVLMAFWLVLHIVRDVRSFFIPANNS